MLGSNIDEVSWPKCGEVDIIEAVNDNDEILSGVHWLDDSTGQRGDYNTKYNVINRDEFHIYELLWDEESIKVFIDESQAYVIDISNIATDAFTKEFFLILNVAVGGNLPQSEIDDSAFPLEMFVDYIEVYQKNSNFKNTPKNLIFELAPEVKPWSIPANENYYLQDGVFHIKDFFNFFFPNKKGVPCFKYGEIFMTVSLPDKQGISTKIYLFKRDKFYYSNDEPVMKTDVKGEIAIATAKDGLNQIIAGCVWNGGDYYKITNDIDPNNYIDYHFIWDSQFIIIYANDIEIYKIDIGPLNDFKNYYYFLVFINEKICSSSTTPEILMKEFKVYQEKKDVIIGLPDSSFISKL